MKIRIIAADQTFTAVLENSEVARDFAALLPIELTLSDYNRTEKIADLPRALSTAGAPEGVAPVAGDIAYYAPWGNLAIFYRDFGYSRGLVRLGRLEGHVEALAKTDAPVRIELIPPLPLSFTAPATSASKMSPNPKSSSPPTPSSSLRPPAFAVRTSGPIAASNRWKAPCTWAMNTAASWSRSAPT